MSMGTGILLRELAILLEVLCVCFARSVGHVGLTCERDGRPTRAHAEKGGHQRTSVSTTGRVSRREASGGA